MSKLRLVEDLEPLSLDDYEHVITMYATEASSIPGVRGIHQFGSVGAPGLSDVDLVVVIDDDAPIRPDELSRLSIKHERWAREPLVRRCFIHDVFVLRSSVFRYVDWLMPGNHWVRRAGAEERRDAPERDDAELVAIAHGLDFCVGRLHEFANIEGGAIHSLRALATELWSVVHTRRLLRNAGAPLSDEWEDLVGALERMRSTPVEEIHVESIEALVPVVRDHFASAVDRFASVLADRGALTGWGPRRECIVALGPRRVLHVYQPVTAAARTKMSDKAVSRCLRFAGRTVEAAWSRLELPGTVMAHHVACLLADERHSALALRMARQGAVSGTEPGSDAYRRVIAKRMHLASLSDRPIDARQIRLSGFRVPGIPVPQSRRREPGTWRLRAARSWLDWRMLPNGVIGVGYR